MRDRDVTDLAATHDDGRQPYRTPTLVKLADVNLATGNGQERAPDELVIATISWYRAS